MSCDMSGRRHRGIQGRRASFLNPDERLALTELIRQRKGEALKVRRANALLLPDGGKSTGFVAKVLFLDPDTVRGWSRDFETGVWVDRAGGLPGREGHLSAKQEAALKAHFVAHPPRDTNEVRDWIRKTFGLECSRPDVSKLVHWLGFRYVKPKHLPKEADEEAKAAFIEGYESRMNGLTDLD